MSKRSTRQKRAIERVFEAAQGPLAARDLVQRALALGTKISLATVYRIVSEGVQNGILTVVRLEDNVARYERADQHHHHHFLCERCEQVFDIAIPCELVAHHVPAQFSMSRHEITLYGHCKECEPGPTQRDEALHS
ncbi:MAG: Fur family transcriptional regulator [Myxococcota bacterium]|nr:Fur family transcriptional regulator [Myxococcota bacterium]